MLNDDMKNHHLTKDDETALKEYLASFDLFIGNKQEGVEYLNYAFRRFMVTVDIIPGSPQPESKLLELGANPYFLTLLLQQFHSYHLTRVNFFGDAHVPEGKGIQVMSSETYHERHEFVYDHVNIEKDSLPYPAGEFDVVLFCEMLEHLIINPTHALNEIHRVLKPGGYLVLTTPNVLACQNFLKLAIGQNIYDRYSGYGVYGRHNREYTPSEVIHLLQACSFEILTVRIEDIHPHSKFIVRLLKMFRKQWRDNIFILAQTRGFPCEVYPDSLYRSVSDV